MESFLAQRLDLPVRATRHWEAGPVYSEQMEQCSLLPQLGNRLGNFLGQYWSIPKLSILETLSIKMPEISLCSEICHRKGTQETALAHTHTPTFSSHNVNKIILISILIPREHK